MPVCSNLPSAGVGSMRLSKGVSQRPEAGPGSRAQNGQLHARRSPVPGSRSSQRSSVWSLVFQKWLWGSESDAQPGSPQPAGGGGRGRGETQACGFLRSGPFLRHRRLHRRPGPPAETAAAQHSTHTRENREAERAPPGGEKARLRALQT